MINGLGIGKRILWRIVDTRIISIGHRNTDCLAICAPVAIISLIFYRYFRRKVDGIVVVMEREAIKMVDVLHNHHTHSDETAAQSEH